MSTPLDQMPHDPLTMARLMVRQVEQLYEAASGSEDARLQAYIKGYGQQQHHAAERAAQMALVSIADDLRRIADHLDRGAAAARWAAEQENPDGKG